MLGATIRKYYFAGSSRVVVRENNELTFLLADHLGSTVGTINSSGNLGSQTRYTAFGETRGAATTSTDYLYTGQRAEGEIGLYFYQARFYDPYLNRFLLPDTIIPGENEVYSPLVVDYHETKLLEQVNKENRKHLEDSLTNSPIVPTNPLAFDRFSYAYNNPLRYTDPDGHFAFLVPLLAGALIGGVISTAMYIVTTQMAGQEITFASAAGAFAGGAVAGAVSVIATPLAGTVLHAAGMAASGTALVTGTAVVNAVGGAASYLTGGCTQNAVDLVMGNSPTFQPTIGGALFNVGVAGVLSPIVGNRFPVANNTMSTFRQANHFIPGRTVSTLLTTQNARNMYSQALIATGVGAFAGIKYAEWE